VAAQLAIAQNSTAANITLAQIGATVQSQQIAASQDVANTSAGDSMAVQTQANMLAANVTQSKNQLSALQTFAANGLDQGLIAQIMSNIQLAAQGLNINKIFMPAYAPAQNAPSYYAPDIQIPNNWASRQDIIHQTADGGS
jgi:hypothetical protein